MRIALDAMGGDYAPAEIVAGAVAAARELGLEIALVGIRDVVEAELATPARSSPWTSTRPRPRARSGNRP